MPIPTDLLDKQLIGSRWTRRVGKHRGTLVTILQFNDAGVKFEVRHRQTGTNNHLKDKRYGYVQWPMFTTLYEPEGILPMIVTIDKEGYVVKTPHVDLTKPVVTEGMPQKEEDMPAPVEPVKVETRICHGPWHYKGGKGTALPLENFDASTRYKGQLNKTCRTCIERTATFDKRDKRYNGKADRVPASAIIRPLDGPPAKFIPAPPKYVVIDDSQKPVVEVPAPVEIPVSLDGQGKYQWKVTIIEPVEKIVWADDLLDLNVKVGEVEIVKVERL